MIRAIDYQKSKRKFRSLLKKKGIDAKRISSELNISTAAVYRWFCKGVLPSTERLFFVAEMLGVKVTDIVVLEGEE